MLSTLLGVSGGITGGAAAPSEASGSTVKVSLFGDRNIGAGSGAGNPGAIFATVPAWAWLALAAVALAGVTALLWSPKPNNHPPPPRRRKS